MTKNNLAVIILAAGKGTRMNSELPKVLHPINNKPMISYVTEAAHQINAELIIAVVGYKYQMVQDALKNEKTDFVLQEEQNGTGHAVMQCDEKLTNFKGNILVLSGDVPFISHETLSLLIKTHEKSPSKATVLTCKIDNPHGYGRIIKNEKNTLKKIIEHKDANEEELKETEINTGIYIFNSVDLFNILPKIKNNNKQKEYYLTDVINILLDKNETISIKETTSVNEIMGINTLEQLQDMKNDL